MNNPKLAELLKWGVANSESSGGEQRSTKAASDPSRGLSAEALAALLGGPSDADRMRDAMVAVLSPEVDLENKLIAFDNLEQLVENIDNANNMEPLGLWTPLVQLLEHEEPEIRKMAAWCIGTAAQNNPKAQERLLVIGVIPTLARLTTDDKSPGVRKKAILALSSGVRNYQPSLDEAVKHLPVEYVINKNIDAADMDAVDLIIQRLRDHSSQLS